MKIIVFASIILLTSCATTFSPTGQLRSISVARNVYWSHCGDCDYGIIDTTEYQTGVVGSSINAIMDTIKATFSALVPRGFDR